MMAHPVRARRVARVFMSPKAAGPPIYLVIFGGGSQKSVTILGRRTIPEPSTPHIGREVALVARTAAFVYIYARIPQIEEMTRSFHATPVNYDPEPWFDLLRAIA